MNEPKLLQEEIWKMIDDLYQSGFITPYIKIHSWNSKEKVKNYNVRYLGRDGFNFDFITSDVNGIWGIYIVSSMSTLSTPSNIGVIEIASLIKEEIRHSKLEHLLT